MANSFSRRLKNVKLKRSRPYHTTLADPPDDPPASDSAAPVHAALADNSDTDPAPFAFKPLQLANLVDPKSFESLEEMGGISGLLLGLGTHRTRGLGGAVGPLACDDQDKKSVTFAPSEESTVPDAAVTHLHHGAASQPSSDAFSASFDDRKRIFGLNVVPVRPRKTIWRLMWTALSEKVLVLLSIAAVVSLALGFFQDFGPVQRTPGKPPIDWVEGVAIVVAIVVAVSVDSLTNWQKERQFHILNAKKEERLVKVIRDRVERQINIHDVVVGDVALLEPGEIIPCDGIFLSGHNVRCDESTATGESDVIKKISYEDYIDIRDRKRQGTGHLEAPGISLLGHTDCFLVSGSKVLEGVGSYVVIAVGTRSFSGRIMIALRGEDEATPLQCKLNRLADTIALAGIIAGSALFFGLLVRFLVEIVRNESSMTPSERGIAFVNILILAVTLVVASVPEGLPLAITLALAFATRRMTYENLLVRVLGSCETMANATVVCTDKTGTLTQNDMAVVAGVVGLHSKFVRDLKQNPTRANLIPSESRALELADLNAVLDPSLRALLNDSIAINSTAFEDVDPDTGIPAFVGNKTETALLKMARDLGWRDYKAVREAAEVLQVIPFSSERKAMGVVVRLPGGRARFFLKGASEILAALCVRYAASRGVSQDTPEIATEVLSASDRDGILDDITLYASQTLRTITLCYRDFKSWPPIDALADNEVPYEVLAQDLTLVAIAAIEDPLRPGVRRAVADCNRAGVQVKMCTGDNVLTAKSIAQQCGIYTVGGIVMEGPHFRSLSDPVRRQIIPRLQVLARSSPEDKRLLVNTLKELDEVVGVTGDGTNDGPALKAAHVGFSMGIAGTEVAKEASNIILMDDNFASIVKAIMWGRAVNDAVCKFLQFQVSVNVIAVIVTLVSGIASSNEGSVLSAVQLLWINIIMDTFAALALATDPASPALLDRKPTKQSAPLFSVDMIKQIVGQSIYQCIVILIFHFLGPVVLGFEAGDKRVSTLVFNAFVFAQIFNSFNCRRLDRKLNVFEGLQRNPYFICITFIEICAQILIIFFGGAVFSVARIGGREWGISLVLGIMTIPVGALVRLVPNEPCERLFTGFRLYRPPSLLPTTSENAKESGLRFAFDKVQDDIGTFRTVRGGRSRISLLFARLSRRPREEGNSIVYVRPLPGRTPNDSSLCRSGLLTMVPSLLGAQIIGSNWSARTSGAEESDGGVGKMFEVHPDTPRDDIVFKLLGGVHMQTS
ncbi:hypothetical protein K488DRAFT_47506 [Vararia minispora EC-137]|uniref:Uncharacterized protein n=1 Tax=Vararia minispora EC-137 TaxID=1314806 RepID=A0ACB8QPH8_9AGAM|nr:hypothetical protein K488DRAFT_47506 [Vararia minispora EC-137]